MRFSTGLEPLREKAFRLQFAAQAVSMLGGSLTPVALAFGVLQATGSASSLGLVLASYSLPPLVLMLAGGVMADRLPRQRMMMIADLTRFASQSSFGLLLIVGVTPLWAMMALQAIAGAAYSFAAPAMIGLTAATSPPKMLQQANALLATTRDVTNIVGPLVAGGLTIAIGGGWALVIDGLSFLASAALLSRLRLARVERRQTRFLRELRDGWHHVVSRDWIWATISYFAFFNLVVSVLLVIGPAQLAATPNGALRWGAIAAALSTGTLCGNALALRVMPKYLLRWPRVLGLLVVPLVVSLALGLPLPVLVVAAFAMGVVMTFPDALWYTALQQEVPDEAISRVSSFDHLGSFMLQPLGYSCAALMIAVGASTSLLVVAAAFASVTLLTLAVPGVRNLSRA